jgi:peptidoglycan/LPS O-acetylase OafA/YrhL
MAERRLFPACDGLRAVAAGSVLLFHAAASTGLATRSAVGPYLSQLDVGVDVFFVLSGFLLYRPFARAHLQGTEPPRIGHYLKRRFLRIFPAYWLVLTVVVYVLHQATIHTPADAAYFYGLGQIYSTQHVLGGLIPAWSLCTEIAFYLFLPLYAVGLRTVHGPAKNKVHKELVGLGSLYAVSVVFRLFLATGHAHIGQAFLPAYLDVFALGMLLAVVSVVAERESHAGWLRVLPLSPATLWASAAALFFAISNMGWPTGFVAPSTGKQLAHHFMAGMIGMLLVCPAVLHHGSKSSVLRLLKSPTMRWLGLISYGIFLWHLAVIEKAVDWTGQPNAAPFWTVLILSVPATVGLAWVTYLVLERPLMRTGSARRAPTHSTAGVAPD